MSTLVYVAIGYAVCVLFPIPGLNAFIISLWAKGWTALKAKLASTPPAK
jgi:hypothetical protein